jgi:uncharacterized protein YecE (DUF72 family)
VPGKQELEHMISKAKNVRTFIGTSGWSYDHWKGVFYPNDLPQKSWFNFYMHSFDTVEINNSFYNLPSESTFKDWYSSTSSDFVFSVKASRYITHMKKLRDPEDSLKKFTGRVKLLKNKLGPILFQLPPRWHCNVERLTDFTGNLPHGWRYTIEFRDDSWWDDGVYELLKKKNIAWCIFDLDGRLSPVEITSDFVYIRLHGPDGAYRGKYGGRKLRKWVNNIAQWLDSSLDVYCYFDNDENGYAPQDALKLKEMLR